jgi:hypothetical protein
MISREIQGDAKKIAFAASVPDTPVKTRLYSRIHVAMHGEMPRLESAM